MNGMTRSSTLRKILTLATALVLLAACRAPGATPTMSLPQARSQAETYAHNVQAQLPGHPTLKLVENDSMSCDDNQSKGKVDLGYSYRIQYDENASRPDNSVILDHMYKYWSAQGLKPTQDDRAGSHGRKIGFGDPRNGFLIGLVEAETTDQLSLDISAPCMWPNGTPGK